jgi:hypothetical protein
VEVDGRSRAELDHGRLVRTWSLTDRGAEAIPLPLDLDPAAPDHLRAPLPQDPTQPGAPLPKALADELACVAAWLDRAGARVRIVEAEALLVPAGPPLPSFEPPVPLRR